MSLFLVLLLAQIPQFGGTFTGAMIASDGIVLASDSRSTFLDASSNRLGYIDGMPKIFVQNSTAFAISGLTSINDELFSSFMRRNDFLLERPVNEILFGLAVWLPFQNSNSIFLISAGYVDGRPMICAKNPIDPQACRSSGYITSKQSPALQRWTAARNAAIPTAAEAASALRLAIREAADLDTAIGGPTTILFLPATGGVQWLENPPNDSGWTKICDIVADHRRGRAQIFFTNSKDDLDRYLDGVCPR